MARCYPSGRSKIHFILNNREGWGRERGFRVANCRLGRIFTALLKERRGGAAGERLSLRRALGAQGRQDGRGPPAPQGRSSRSHCPSQGPGSGAGDRRAGALRVPPPCLCSVCRPRSAHPAPRRPSPPGVPRRWIPTLGSAALAPRPRSDPSGPGFLTLSLRMRPAAPRRGCLPAGGVCAPHTAQARTHPGLSMPLGRAEAGGLWSPPFVVFERCSFAFLP